MASELSEKAKQRLIERDNSPEGLPEADRALGVRLGILPPQRAPRPAAPTAPVPPATAGPAAGMRPPPLQPSAKTQAEEEAARNRALRIGPIPFKTQTLAQEMFPIEVGNPPNVNNLSIEQWNQVTRAERQAEEDKGFDTILREAGKYLFPELNSMESAMKMADTIRPLITREHVGPRGWVNKRLQTIEQQLGYDTPFDPAYQQLETFSHIIGNLHAAAVKRIGGGGGAGVRGATQFDIKTIDAWLNPYAMGVSHKDLLTALDSIQELIKQTKPLVYDELRTLGIDPTTRGKIRGRSYGGVPTEPGTRPEPGAEGFRLTDPDLDRLLPLER